VLQEKRFFYRKPVKAQIERALRTYGIDYAAYHGGDLVGNDCRKLMEFADDICKDLENILLARADEMGMKLEMKAAIVDRCNALCYTLVCFDSIFSLMFKPNEKVEMEVDLPNLRLLLRKALVGWQSLKKVNKEGYKNIPPKVHALVQHLETQFEEYGGIGDFDEQFVERSHQSGKRDMFRSRAIRCRENKYKCFARWEEVRSNPQVMAISETVHKNRKRKFKGEVEAVSRRQLKQEARIARRSRLIVEFIPKILFSAADLTLMELDREPIIDANMETIDAAANSDLDDDDAGNNVEDNNNNDNGDESDGDSSGNGNHNI
jgi:hypothetical protein